MKYFFQLGYAPALAGRELSAVLTREGVKFKKQVFSPHEVFIDSNKPLEVERIIAGLGGSIRAAELVGVTEVDELAVSLARVVSKQGSKPCFGLSAVNLADDMKGLSQSVKKKLVEEGHGPRFLVARQRFLDPIQLRNGKCREYVLVSQDKMIGIYQTRAVSDTIEWQKRDRGRPAVDAKSGVMPPKVARMLVNLALADKPDKDTMVLDPFCGSGTILAEAMMVGCNVVGFDVSERAVEDSKENLAWVKKEFNLGGSIDISKADVNQLTSSQLPTPPTAIVAEGDLGPQERQDKGSLVKTIGELEGFYDKALDRLMDLLPKGGRLVIALPLLPHSASVKSLKNLIDRREKAGYTLLSGPIKYAKPGARVKRAIYVLRKD